MDANKLSEAETKFLPKFQEKLTREIEIAFKQHERDAATALVDPHRKPLTLQEILGNKDHGSWWRLYIDPKDWQDALAKDPADPGSFYSAEGQESHRDGQNHEGSDDKPLTWKAMFTIVYEKYLEHSILSKDEPLSWQTYAAIWHDTIRTVSSTNQGGYQDRTIHRDIARYPSQLKLAADTKVEQFAKRPFVVMHASQKDDLLPGICVNHWPDIRGGIGESIAVLSMGDLRTTVEGIFHDFHTKMAHQKLRFDQLKIIAHTIRTLHMLHPFSNGSGRVNVHTLLPAMLMKYGFGLPLGGQHGQGVDRWCQYTIFNGGFSVEEIAKWLWIMQDFGHIDPKHSVVGDHPPIAHPGASTTLQEPVENGTVTTPPHVHKSVTFSEPKTFGSQDPVREIKASAPRPSSISHLTSGRSLVLQ